MRDLALHMPDWAAAWAALGTGVADGLNALRRLDANGLLLLGIAVLLVLLCGLLARLSGTLSRFSRRQLGLVTDLAQAASAATHYQREMSERQLRAYVDVAAVSFHRFAPGQELVIRVEVRNHGLTPALDLLARITLAVLPFPASDLPEPEAPPADGRPFVLAAREGRAILQHMDITNAAGTAERLLTGELGLYVLGNVTYADVFGHTHTSTMSMVASGEQVKTNQPFTRCEAGNHIA
ncbi:hypothetical protein [Methylobacterium sp. ID0610]|uniref:hypothetical protein n=1 Tax=Methylobacterium carpenticola TaxID=3344827 RepID=UPI0036C625A9